MQKRSQSEQSFRCRHQPTRHDQARLPITSLPDCLEQSNSAEHRFTIRKRKLRCRFVTVTFVESANGRHLISESCNLSKCTVQRCMCRVNLCVELETCDCFFSLRHNCKCNDLQLPYPQFHFSCQRIGSLEAKQKRGDWSLPQQENPIVCLATDDAGPLHLIDRFLPNVLDKSAVLMSTIRTTTVTPLSRHIIPVCCL